MTVERYGIYWVDLNPVRGSELAKLRPAAAELRHVITEMYGVLSVSDDDTPSESQQ